MDADSVALLVGGVREVLHDNHAEMRGIAQGLDAEALELAPRPGHEFGRER